MNTDSSALKPTPTLYSFLSLRAHAHTIQPADDPVVELSSGEETPPKSRRALAAGVIASVVGAAVVFAAAPGDPPAARAEVVCGKAGPRISESGAAQRWQQREIVVTIDSSVDKLGPNARESIQNAFGTWISSDENLPDLRFESNRGEKLTATMDGVNAVLVAPIRGKGHQSDLAITISYSDPETGEIRESDIVINAERAFAHLPAHSAKGGKHKSKKDGSSCNDTSGEAEACGRRYDLQNVVTHEVGHFFGLAEDSSVDTATMYLCTSACETHKRDLADVDSSAIAELYAGGFAEETTAGCGGARMSPGRTAPRGAAAAALLAALAWMARRRRSRA